MENFAVIDLGSNSCRMTITQIQEDGSYAVTHRLKEMVRLSENENATDTPTLQAEAIDRTIAALKSFAAVYKDLPNLTIKPWRPPQRERPATKRNFSNALKMMLA